MDLVSKNASFIFGQYHTKSTSVVHMERNGQFGENISEGAFQFSFNTVLTIYAGPARPGPWLDFEK